MIVKTLWALDADGTIELLEAIDEFSDDSNPDWMEEKIDEHDDRDVRVVDIEISHKSVANLFEPKQLMGTVLSDEPDDRDIHIVDGVDAQPLFARIEALTDRVKELEAEIDE